LKKSTLKIDLESIQTDKRVLGRALSIIENEDAAASPWYESLYKSTGKARIWGFTGAPGAGKSSLINVLIKEIRKNLNLSVAILAIDPSSPYTGGAILGDRTRMYESGNDEKVFIRSSASRGKLGGLSSKTPEMIHILDAAGFDIIIVETVGVGQGELDIMRIADVITVVLSPHNGDSLQTLKAGIIEVADIFALNKSDLSAFINIKCLT
jgi:LAO/AO transport system kinase